jgi:hypothetical protein
MQSKKYKKELLDRSEFLYSIVNQFADKSDSILEIGEGDGRNVEYLKDKGYNVIGIDKLNGTAIEDVPINEYDVVYTMSTLFLIPPENNWVFEKISKMAKKYIITIEGETTDTRRDVWGRNYTEIFEQFGFDEVYHLYNVFNEYGVLRILKRK